MFDLPPEFAAALESTRSRRGRFGEPTLYLAETDSTNSLAARLADQGATEGTVVVAGAQTAGRGRLGRAWHSPPHCGLYASAIVRDTRVASLLTLAGGVAAADAIRAATGLPVEIKWPNDVVVAVGGASTRRRKLAGVLAEATSGTEGVVYVVIGFGINLRAWAYPPEIAQRATSIEEELGRAVEAAPLLAELLAALALQVERLASRRVGEVLTRWRQLAPTVCGSQIAWESPHGRISGVASGIDDHGALLVKVGDRTERIVAGEITWTC